MVQIIHTARGKPLDKIITHDFKKTVSAMRKAPYSDNYRRQLVSLLKGVALYLSEHVHDIAGDKVNKVKFPKKQWKVKTAEEMLTYI